jgi:hypothetical protein
MPDDYTDEAALLEELARRGWLLYRLGDPNAAPELMVAVKRWEFVSDVVALRGHDRVTAYRAPATFGSDPLRAEYVIWDYAGHAAYVLDRVLRLSGEFAAPYPIPESCRIPELDRWPFTMRPPQHSQQPRIHPSQYLRQPPSTRPYRSEQE